MADPANTTGTPAETPLKTNHVLETPADSPDPDQVEYDAALKAAQEETQAAAQAPAGEQPAVAGEAQPQPQEQATAPVDAVIAERRKRQEAEDLARQSMQREAYWKGVAEGRLPQSAKVAATPVEAPSIQRERTLRSEMIALAKDVDDGKLSNQEYEERRQNLQDELTQIHDEDLIAKVKPAQNNDLYLQTITHQLETENQWLAKVPENRFEILQPIAYEKLAERGIDMKAIAGTPLGDYELRRALLDVMKEHGYDKAYSDGAGAQPAQSGVPAGVTARPTAQHVADKQALAARAPPTPVGGAAPQNAMTEQRIEEMSDLDLENMPLSELKKIGDGLDREVAARRVASPTRR